METKRQLKVSRLLQRDLAQIFQLESRNVFGGAMITVTKVNITKDLATAKVFLSLFGMKDKEALTKKIKQRTKDIRRKLGYNIKNQLRVVPELEFFEDDSLDYIENIERLLADDNKYGNDQK